MSVQRHRTALTRANLSRPIAVAFEDGILSSHVSLFDYGCGRGGDVKRLRDLGIQCAGWDPVYFPTEERLGADLVNLGFVINVIEDPDERAQTLRAAWELAHEVLIVSARLAWTEAGPPGTQYNDGILTGRGTFQRLFTQEELREWIDGVLGVSAIAAAPGVFYVFRREERSQQFLASRYRRTPSVPSPHNRQMLFETHRELLQPLMDFVAKRGRLPELPEISAYWEISAIFGSLGRAFRVIRGATGTDRWEQIRQERQEDLLVYLALSRLGRRPRLSGLPSDIYFDVKAHFGTYKSACGEADKLLFGAGTLQSINEACRNACVGKLTKGALYVHSSALSSLPSLLRIYEGCARYLTGTVQGANIIKLNRQKPQVSYLVYPDFENDPHPRLSISIRASLKDLHVRYRDFRQWPNPPVLHRKDAFLDHDNPLYAKFRRLTLQEERWGLLDDKHRIGTLDGWQSALEERKVLLKGHRLVRSMTYWPHA